MKTTIALATELVETVYYFSHRNQIHSQSKSFPEMTATPKWFARYKDDIEIIFSKIQLLQVEFKHLTTKFLLETQKTIICDYVSIFLC